MTAVATVARKELAALFQSAVAMIFLGVFLAFTLFAFFSASGFFARNLADVRPLFEWLPLLLIGLVSAVTMRAWAEERKAGTLEVLLTLPVRTAHLVLGKFAAGMGLIAVALALTLPLPIVVSTLGPLDWGPVVGGYVGALLLGGAYLALGLAVSARTDNQIVALMTTLLVGGALYLVGAEPVTELLGNRGMEIARAIGTGARFESIERGVLDLRDLVYYLGLTAFFLVLNGVFLEVDRADPGSDGGRAHRARLWSLAGLAALNAVLANVWLAPVTAARIDLTANKDYSISPVTRDVLASLDERLVIRGYFSERTHPWLAPLVPQIRDMLEEYAIAGGGKVDVEILDPAQDEALEQEIGEQYGIRTFAFEVPGRRSLEILNGYFHILVKYGDEYEVLDFRDLVEIDMEMGDARPDVRLRNLEYDLTSTIRRVSQDFESLDSILAKLPEPATFTLYITPDKLPEGFQSTAEAMEKAGEQIAARSGGKVRFEKVDPSADPSLQQKLFDEYGVQPLAVDLFGEDTFYLHMVLDFGDAVERLMPRGDLTEADVTRALEAAVKRATPGQLKTVGIFTEQPEAPPQDPRMPPQFQPPAPEPDYQGIRQLLSDDHQVRPVQLDDGYVPDEIDVLIVGKPGELTADQAFAIDQYLMRGGAVIALAGRYRVKAEAGQLSASPEPDAFFDQLQTYGVNIDKAMVMDPQNAAFPIPVVEQRGMFRMQRIELLPYPFFPDIRASGFNRDHPVLAGLNGVTTPWASPVSLAEELPEGAHGDVLLTTSEGSWLNTTGDIKPDFTRWPGTGFGPTGETGPRTVAVALTGRFPSAYPDRARALEASVADGRLLVVGSSEFVSDILIGLANQPNGEVHRGNFQFLQNAIDWATEDTDLLAIRSSGAFARTLQPMDEAQMARVEWTTYALVGVPFLLVILVPRLRRARVEPIPLPEGGAA